MRYIAILLLMVPNCVSAQCGVERWQIKNLLDPAKDSLRIVAVPSLATIDTFAPRVTVNESTPRLDFEKQIVLVRATVVQMKRERDDGDIHLLLQDDSGYTMIAEVPNPDTCSDVAQSSYAGYFRDARQYVIDHFGKPTTTFKDVGQRVEVQGVLFQDFPHGQKGAAPNYREIHPVLMLTEIPAAVKMDETLGAKIEVQPNPSQTYLHISARVQRPAIITGFRISDPAGRILVTSSIQDIPNDAFTGDIDISNLPNGTYYLSVQTNRVPIVKPFTVQR